MRVFTYHSYLLHLRGALAISGLDRFYQFSLWPPVKTERDVKKGVQERWECSKERWEGQ